MSNRNAKKAAGQAAAEFVEDGMLVGLGTGSTAECFIESLIARCQKGLKIQAVATSNQSSEQAREGGIPILDIIDVSSVNLTVDGADEIDPQKRMIKGGGGALLREKIIAAMSDEMVVVVDEKKLVDKLGAFPLPVEILTFGHKATLRHLGELGYHGHLRKGEEKKFFLTENGNYIYDVVFESPCDDPENIDQRIRNVPGVVETGFFFQLAGRIIVGYPDGHTEIWR